MPKMEMVMTPAQAGKFLRTLAEAASRSEKWDDFEQICVEMIRSARDAERPTGAQDNDK